MSLQQSVTVRNARLDAVETAIGTAPILKLRTGPVPASCAAADTGTVVATLNLPSDWMTAASGGSKSKSGTWEDPSADADGIIAHFRVYASDGVTCHLQGSATTAGGGGDMIVDNTNVKQGQAIVVSTFTLTAGNQ